jgi:hypothetical protein
MPTTAPDKEIGNMCAVASAKRNRQARPGVDLVVDIEKATEIPR